MANEAWSLGWQTGSKLAADQRARKEMLADEDRKLQVTDLFKQRDDIVKALPNYKQGTPEYDSAIAALDTIHSNVDRIYHPDHNPGALQKDWGWLSGHLRKAKTGVAPLPDLPTTTPGATITDAQTVTMPETPAYLRPGAAPSAGAPGTLAQDITLPSVPIGIPGTTEPTVKAAAQMMTPQQLARLAKARGETQLDVAGMGQTPEQVGATAGRTWGTEQEEKLNSVLRLANQLGVSEQDQKALKRSYLDAVAGVAAKPVWKEYIGPNGEKQYLDATRPDQIPPGWNAAGGAESADTRTRADFATYQKQHPEYTGTFEQWKVEQGQLARQAVPTNRDDRYISIMQKRAANPSQPLDRDDQDYANAYDMYINKRVLSPIYARAAAMANDRYVQVMDPSNPEKVTFMRAGDAATAGAGTPASIGFQIDKAVTRFMTSGAGAQNIANFNTAESHLELLGKAADALNNGQIQIFNAWGNAFATATGEAAPTNFESVKNAVAGEISKTFKGTGATEGEIALINQTINQAMSPAQLKGAIDYYQNLMGGKLQALQSQFTMGKQGQPAFTPTPNAPGADGGGGGTATPGKSKGAVSISAAKLKPKYAGMSDTQISNAITVQGYTPIP